MTTAGVAGEDSPIGPQESALQNLGKRTIGTHDPSTIVRCGKEYWFFGTGRGIASYRSTDLKNWTPGPRVFKDPPAWTKELNAKFNGFFWAPDVIWVRGQYLLYYSVSTFGSQTSAIGMVSTPTLDPADRNFGWTDHGIVVQSSRGKDFNALDASVMLDHAGQLWMTLGSFWSGIKLQQLDPKTGLALPNSPLVAVAWNKEIEASAIFEHDGWYYLIVNWGLCCRGIHSTYSMHIGRSRKAEGPYVDRAGKDLQKGGGDLLLGSDGDFIGPGHAGIFVDGDRTLISMHFYDGTRNGAPALAIRELTYSNDGWPTVGSGAK